MGDDKEKGNINDVERCLCTELRRAARELTRLYDKAMPVVKVKECDTRVRITQYAVLRALANTEWSAQEGSGPECARGVSQKALADHLHLDSTAVCRNLRVLKVNGWVLDASEKQARDLLLVLTDEGRAVYEKCQAEWRKVQGKVVDKLSTRRGCSHSRLLSDCDIVSEIRTALINEMGDGE